MTKINAENPRRLALELLLRMQSAKQFSNIALDKALLASSLSEADKRLASALFYGVIERLITLDARISALSSRQITEIEPQVLNTLRLGIYQLSYMDKIPPHAAINETVELCSRRTKGFVNGILRAHTRTPNTPLPSREDCPVEHLSLKHSIGVELCRKFIDILGFERADTLFGSLCGERGATLRVNVLRTSRDGLLAHVDGAEADAQCLTAIKVRGSVRELYGFEEGLFFVQDRASQICVRALDARAGERVIDVCSCPGSKAFGAAIDMQNTGEVLAFDLHAKKLPLIESGARRLGIDIIKAAVCDGRVPIEELFDSADRVLCDVPCSGFGVLAKKPELRYKDPADSDALPDIQLAILENASRYLKRGGTLIYSTCTLFPEENEGNVKRFLARNGDFSLVPFDAFGIEAPEGYLTLYPDVHGTDGFFIARLTKN